MNDWFEVDSESKTNHKAIWLVVEESAFTRAQIKDVLSPYSIRILEASDTLRAVDLLTQVKNVDLVICEINLLRMNGVALLEGVKVALQRTIPLYVLSEENKFDLVNESEKFGAIGWLNKPSLVKDLKALASKFDIG